MTDRTAGRSPSDWPKCMVCSRRGAVRPAPSPWNWRCGLRVSDGDEVILAGYDFPGNFRAVEAVGAVPVLVDIQRRTWCLDAAQLELAWSPRVRAILVSHLHGGLAAMPEIRAWADLRAVAVVEDACQVPGARIDGRLAGTWGDVGVLSFGGSKLLSAGRGGALLTDRSDVVQRIKIYSERGNQAYPLSELQAAVLLPQLESLAERNQQRLENAMRLLELCRGFPDLEPVTWDATEAVRVSTSWAGYLGPKASGSAETIF